MFQVHSPSSSTPPLIRNDNPGHDLRGGRESPHTAGHQKRAAGPACAIAGEMGLDEAETPRLTISDNTGDPFTIPTSLLPAPVLFREKEYQLTKT
jgi:hypothetical protein